MDSRLLMFVAAILLMFISGFLLGGCQSNTGNGNVSIPMPGVGQWVAFGGNENPVQGNAINFNCCGGGQISGYYYTKLAATPQVGQTITLTYTLTGNNPQFTQQPGSPTDTNPATNSLLIWQAGDNLSCQGDYNFYRLFPRINKTVLALGTHTISVPLSGADWQGCYPDQVVTDARLQQALNNAVGIGFTFGGANFDGHGIYLSGGSATFTFSLAVK